MLRLLVAAGIAAPFAVGALSASAADRDIVFRFQDPAILESSGLVVTDSLVVTTNDSGDGARIFAVDLADGRTLGTISYSVDVSDVEALAPAGDGAVWVGDIGDNQATRHDISVSRVPVGPADADVDPTTYAVRFEGGPRDAEALLAHPVTGRLYVVSKGVLGGEFFEAPAELDASKKNTLKPIGAAPGLATDAAFFPNGKHVIVRNYGRAVVYRFPSLEVVGEFSLPAQQQGEGLAVGPDGRIYLSSEGARSELLRVTLPLEIRQAMDPTATYEEDTGSDSSGAPNDSETSGPGEGESTGSEESTGSDASGESAEDTDPDVWPWAIGGLFGLAAIAVLILSLKRR